MKKAIITYNGKDVTKLTDSEIIEMKKELNFYDSKTDKTAEEILSKHTKQLKIFATDKETVRDVRLLRTAILKAMQEYALKEREIIGVLIVGSNHCPKCNPTNIGDFMATEFSKMKCSTCGHEWQLLTEKKLTEITDEQIEAMAIELYGDNNSMHTAYVKGAKMMRG